MSARPSILMIYTGGTIGMMEDPESGRLKPLNFDQVAVEIPELKKFQLDLDILAFEQPIDSSLMQPETWLQIAHMIESNYERYDGFVVLHGSDTMAYTASALSFLLDGLAKPVILTGSQLPLGTIRTDGKENLVTAIEIASAKHAGYPRIQEVAVYFEYQLYRGNRVSKVNAEHFEAFVSANYPVLAEAGVHIKYTRGSALRPTDEALTVHRTLDLNVASLKLYPGLSVQVLDAVLGIPNLKGLVIESFGAGNGLATPEMEERLTQAVEHGLVIVNISQCSGGAVEHLYEASAHFERAGVINGRDLTFEAAITKLMFLLGTESKRENVVVRMAEDLRGEITASASN